jgi:holo-[acyl-carrier protein] synthase
MIVGVGVDIVDVARFEASLERTPALADRLFTDVERGLPVHSLAARFAAKEAFIKAMGGSGSMGWHDMSVAPTNGNAPVMALSGEAAKLAFGRGVTGVHLSLSHDGGQAVAFVVAEAAPGSGTGS